MIKDERINTAKSGVKSVIKSTANNSVKNVIKDETDRRFKSLTRYGLSVSMILLSGYAGQACAFLSFTEPSSSPYSLSSSLSASPVSENINSAFDCRLTHPVAAGPLDHQLLTLGRICGVQMLFSHQLTTDLTSPAIPEGSTLYDALIRILPPHQLSAESVSSKTLRLVRASPPGNPQTASRSSRQTEDLPEDTALSELPPFTVHAYPEYRRSVAGQPRPLSSGKTLFTEETRQLGISQGTHLTPQFTGLTRNDGESRRDEYYLRGFKIRRETYRDGLRDDNLYHRDLYNVASVQAVKGADSILYGRGGGPGLMHIQTHKPDGKINALTLSSGSEQGYRLVLDHGDNILSDNPHYDLSYRINLLAEEHHSFRDPVYFKRYGVTSTLAWQKPEDYRWLQFEALQQRSILDRGIIANPDTGQIVSSDRRLFYGDKNDQAQTDLIRLRWQQDKTLSSSLQRSTSIAWSHSQLEAINSKPVELLTTPIAAGTSLRTEEYSSEAEDQIRRRVIHFPQQQENLWFRQAYLWHTSSGTELTAGAELAAQHRQLLIDHQKDSWVSLQTPEEVLAEQALPEQTEVNIRNKLQSAGAFISLRYPLQPGWWLETGLRGDRLWSQQQNRLAIASDADEQTGANQTNGIPEENQTQRHQESGWEGLIRVSHTPEHPILHPDLSEQYWLAFSDTWQPAAHNLYQSLPELFHQAPERYQQWELGGRWQTRRHQVLLNLFIIEQHNRLLTRGDLRENARIQDKTQAHASASRRGQGKSYGLELEFSSRLRHDWQVSGHYSLQKASGQSVSGSRYTRPNSAQHTALLQSRYDLAPQWHLLLEGYATGERFADKTNQVSLPAYQVVNLSLGYQSHNLNGTLNLHNLTDEHYYTSANNALLIEPGKPRTIQLTVNWTY